MGKTNDHYQGALLEEVNHRLKLVQEALEPLQGLAADVHYLKQRQSKTVEWADIAKLVIKDQSKTLNNHDRRLTKLETA